MSALSNQTLLTELTRAASGCQVTDHQDSPKPATLTTTAGKRFRIYLWTVTPDNSRAGRPAGEHKLQIILPESPRHARQHFDLSGDATAILLGFSPVYGVFVIWEIEGHQGASYSKNVQVPESLLMSASENGWAVAEPRNLNHMQEVRCAVHPSHLIKMLETISSANQKNLRGTQRQTFLESNAPDLRNQATTSDPNKLKDIAKSRELIHQKRLSRDSGFSKKVLPLFHYSCAICGTQMNVVEAAHILPVHDSRSTDHETNGIALCRNHHRLFDTRILKIDETQTVRVDDEVLNVIRQAGRHNGLDVLVSRYQDEKLAVSPTNDSQEFLDSWRQNLKAFFLL